MRDRVAAELPAAWFDRIDETPDQQFYASPRFVQHLDDAAIAAVTEAVARHVAPGADVLDLMSSWVSHLPDAADLPLGRVVGVGMNAAELKANPRLDAWLVRDLNEPPAGEPLLPFPAEAFNAVLITVSIQYLTDPVAVLRDAARVLRPGGVLLVSLSDRMFATKATRVWQETPADTRPGLVSRYIELTAAFDPPATESPRPPRRGPTSADPLWVVITRKRR